MKFGSAHWNFVEKNKIGASRMGVMDRRALSDRIEKRRNIKYSVSTLDNTRHRPRRGEGGDIKPDHYRELQAEELPSGKGTYCNGCCRTKIWVFPLPEKVPGLARGTTWLVSRSPTRQKANPSISNPKVKKKELRMRTGVIKPEEQAW